MPRDLPWSLTATAVRQYADLRAAEGEDEDETHDLLLEVCRRAHEVAGSDGLRWRAPARDGRVQIDVRIQDGCRVVVAVRPPFGGAGRVTRAKPRTSAKHRESRSAQLDTPPKRGDTGQVSSEGIDWSRIDWSRSNADLAAELGCATSSVSYARARHGHPSGRKSGRPELDEDDKTESRGVRLQWQALDEYAGGKREAQGLLRAVVADWLHRREDDGLPARFLDDHNSAESRGARLPQWQWRDLDEAGGKSETPALLRAIVAEWLERQQRGG